MFDNVCNYRVISILSPSLYNDDGLVCLKLLMLTTHMVLEIDRDSKDILTEVTMLIDRIALQATSKIDLDQNYVTVNKEAFCS